MKYSILSQLDLLTFQQSGFLSGKGHIVALHALIQGADGIGAGLAPEVCHHVLHQSLVAAGMTGIDGIDLELGDFTAMGLQEKLGLYPAKGRVHWLCGNRR